MDNYRLLERLDHETISNFTDRELTLLGDELRRFLVETVSKTGGHLASNLGIVEISLALQLCFNPECDRIVYDVGHQCYVHKILNGRRDVFNTLRQSGGISGFTRPSESPADAFISGHASTSVSAALGFSRAAKLRGEKAFSVAVIGDGALTGGMAYEALNDAGSSGEPIIVILNDNGMSITKNVGAMATYFSHMRIKGTYLNLKKIYHKIFDRRALLRPLDRFFRYLKNGIKRLIMPPNFFDDMGFLYYGPYDGHDLPNLRYQIETAKKMGCPVLLHVKTVKGKGYSPAEGSPNIYHGVSPFNPSNGLITAAPPGDYSAVAGERLCELAEENGRICAVTAAMPYSTGLTGFSRRFPRRFFDVGIAEAHAVTMSAGLAAGGMIPVFAVYSSFLQRGYDQLIHDASIQRQHLILLVDRAGLVGEDGETHHGIMDVGFLTQIPGSTVYSPANTDDLIYALNRAVNDHDGLVAVRYPKVSKPCAGDSPPGESAVIRDGSDISILTYGRASQNVLEAAERLGDAGISCKVVRLNRIWPLDIEQILSLAADTGRLAVIEEVVSGGSIGEHIAAAIARAGINTEFLAVNIGNTFVPQGNVAHLLDVYGLSADKLYEKLSEFAGKNNHEIGSVSKLRASN